MKRYRDWEQRLHAICQERKRAPFVWGEHDCALFVADCVQAITGQDLAAECRSRYSSKEEAATLLTELCGGNLETYMEQRGLQEWATVRLAQRGDIVLSRQTTGPCLGIVSLDGMRGLFAVESGQDEMLRLSVLECARAWRV